MNFLELDPIPVPTEKLGVEFSPNGKVGIREVVGINLATLTLTLTLNVLTKDTEQTPHINSHLTLKHI